MMSGLYGARSSGDHKSFIQRAETEPGPVTRREKGPGRQRFRNKEKPNPIREFLASD